MTRQLLIKELSERHSDFVNYILSLSLDEFMFSTQNKWTAGQQMEHIFRATSLLPFAFKIPLLFTGIFFGNAKRQPYEYNELVEKYLSGLEKGAKAPHLYIPKKIPYSYRVDLADKVLNNVSGINDAIDKFSEQEMDRYLLPHPLLGKISYREMIYFTIYHVNHHCESVKRNIAAKYA